MDPCRPLCGLLRVLGGLLEPLPRLFGPLWDLLGTSWVLSNPSWGPLGVLLGTPPGRNASKKIFWDPKAGMKAPQRRKFGCISLFLNTKNHEKSIFALRKCKKTRVLTTCVGNLQSGHIRDANAIICTKTPEKHPKKKKTPFSPRF